MKGARAVAAQFSLRSASRRAFWSSLEAFTWPALWLIATPWFVGVLGQADFGLLMFVNALAIVAALSGLGLGAAVVKLVAHEVGASDHMDAAHYVRAALTIGLVVGAALSLLTIAASGFLAAHLFVRLGPSDEVATLIVLGVVVVGVQQIDQIVASGLKGMQRFDLSALVDVVSKGTGLGLMMLVAARTADVSSIVIAQVGCLAVGTISKGWLLGRLLGRPILRFSFDKVRMAEVFGFGKWIWLQNIAGLATVALDRLVVAALFGPAVLGAYTICHMAGQVMHNFISACFQPVFPRVSALAASNQVSAVAALARRVMAANMIVVVTICTLLVVFSDAILTLWMGSAFAIEHEGLFRMFIVLSGLMGLNVGAYYTLLGLGESRTVAVVSAAGGVGSVVALALLAPLGALHAAAARGVYVVASLGLVVIAHRRVRDRRANVA